MWSRRQLLQAGLLAAGAAALPACRFFSASPLSMTPAFPSGLPTTTPWPEANAILARVVVPKFADATFSVGDFGARGDGRFDNTAAFADAIAACQRAGGGHVTVPPGRFIVGAIRLRSGVDLNLAAGCTLAFSGDASKYPIVLTRYEGIECMNRSPMIYAHGESDLGLTGAGTLDASATAEWNHGRDREKILETMVAAAVPVEDRNVAGRLRATFVEPYACNNVLISGVTLTGSRFWQIHPTLCHNVTVDGVTTSAASFGTTDGCDPESCDGVVIKRCTLAAGDDNIAIKSGRDADGRRLAAPSQNIVIMNCQAEGPDAFVACGSEQSGGIQNVFIYNNWSYGRGRGRGATNQDQLAARRVYPQRPPRRFSRPLFSQRGRRGQSVLQRAARRLCAARLRRHAQPSRRQRCAARH